MKKNFFKKLSFVVALAMIISTIAPAAGAFAATKAPKLNSGKEYLFLGTSDNKYDFNIANKQKGWKYEWTSENEDVATVASNGLVTAKAIGTTKVSVLITKKGEEVDTLDATVIVKDNIATLKVTGTPAGDKLAVGKENTFSTSFVTVSGSTTKTTSVVNWAVDSTNATITDKGVFVASKAGEFTVTARAFQSTEKMKSWLVDNTKYASYVLATATYKVTVPNDIKDLKATKVDTFTVNFASPVKAVVKDSFVLTNATTSNKVYIKSVTLSSDKASAEVVLYDAMTSGTTYNLKATVDGVAMSGSLAYVKGTPAKIVAPTAQTVKVGTATKIAYSVYDENGLDITGDTTVHFFSTFNNVNYSTGYITLNTAGQLEYVYIVYTNPTTGAQIKSEQIAVTASTATGTDFVGYTVQNVTISGGAYSYAYANYTYPTLKLALNGGPTASSLNRVAVSFKDQFGNVLSSGGTSSSFVNLAGLTFDTLDPSVFVVDNITGVITPVAVGVGSFRINYGNVHIVKTIEITANPYKAALVANSTSLRVSNTGWAQYLNQATLNVGYKDQYSNSMTVSENLNMMVLDGNQLVKASYTQGGVTTYLNSGNALVAGATYQIPAGVNVNFYSDTALATSGNVALQVSGTNSLYTIVNVYVGKTDSVEVGYSIAGVKDLNKQAAYDYDGSTTNDQTTFTVYAVNAEGFYVEKATGASITVAGPNGSWTTASNTVAFNSNLADASNAATYATGAYTVTAKLPTSNVVIAQASFNLTDSGVMPAVYLLNNKLQYTINNTNLKNIINLSGLNILNIKYLSSDTTKFASQPTEVAIWANGTWDTAGVPITGLGGATLTNFALYNVSVDLYDWSGRIWNDVQLGTIYISQ